jgi:ParB-like chromosome segregation protein Spo0J
MSFTENQIRPIHSIHPNPENARAHPKNQIRGVANLIKEADFIDAIVVNKAGKILAGEGRYLTAKLLEIEKIPVIVVDGLTEAREIAYGLANNRLGEKSGWDGPALATALSRTTPLLAEEGLSIEVTGFEAATIDSLMGDFVDPSLPRFDLYRGCCKRPESAGYRGLHSTGMES